MHRIFIYECDLDGQNCYISKIQLKIIALSILQYQKLAYLFTI